MKNWLGITNENRLKAYKLRMKGFSWYHAAEKTGFSSGFACKNSIIQFANEHNLPPPPENRSISRTERYGLDALDRKKAYLLRCKTRLTWKEIAAQTNYQSKGSCMVAAKNYAKKHNLPPPPKFAMLKMEMTYEDRTTGAEWWQIAMDLAIPTAKDAQAYAKVYAKQNGLPIDIL